MFTFVIICPGYLVNQGECRSSSHATCTCMAYLLYSAQLAPTDAVYHNLLETIIC